ncbi:Branched-chain amino acid transport protein (AzlD) [Izhakiella capsodis]|uniref:Branched-chain amino acid transport protein (AzlD) n=1 Tax=Izhakiella capsodis TaxID=1367852 RepID=A0A1I4UQA9_9GAMM|nr:AzlD domain-containing protein [Izhakiella capsodis]SFM91128.1 Branched-chain amino acid transport protein (AzlD) [Izhakiella capsodis]
MMEHPWWIVGGILALAVGTYLIRLMGVVLGNRLGLGESSRQLLNDAATILLVTVAVSAAFQQDGHFSGAARVAGVVAGLLLALARQSIIVVVITAAAVTAILRYFGIH